MISERMQNLIADLRGSLMKLKMNPRGNANLNDIRDSLNAIFGEDKVKQVIYTDNTDKVFFGLIVMPIIPAKDIIDIFLKNDHYVINQVYVELDSKMFNEMLNLSLDEITALVIREVGHMVADASPIETVKADIDNYLYQKNITIKLSDSIHYAELLSFGVRDAIRKTISIFEAPKGEQIDQFDIDCEIDEDLKSAMKKIDDNGYNFNSEIDNKLIFLSWVLRLYRNVLEYRIAAIHTLKKTIELTPSILEKKECGNIITRLERIDDDSLLTEATFLDDIVQNLKRSAKTMKMQGIQKYEDDYYEIQFQVNNLETQDDAVLLLHQISSRMAVLDDLLSSEEMSKGDYAKWRDLYHRYNQLRSSIAKNKIYQNKTRLNVNYGMDD